MARSLIRLAAVVARTGLSKSTIYARIQAGEFPKPVSLGASSKSAHTSLSAWVDDEVSEWIDARIRERDGLHTGGR